MATANQEKIFLIPSLDGGMQQRTTEFVSGKTECKFIKNANTIGKLGALTKVPGYTHKGNAVGATTILGAGALNTAGGVDKLVAFLGTDAYVYNSSTGAWDAQSKTFTAAQKFETASLLDMLFVVNGLTDAPQSYTGSAWSTTTNVTNMPKARYISEYKNRLFLYNITLPVGGAYPSRVWYSDLPKNNTITWDYESGTDLAQSAASAVVTSAAALFISRGIKTGDTFVITDGSNAGEYEVDTVDSETQITLTQTLANAQTGKTFWVGGNWFDVARGNSDIGHGLIKNFDRLLCFKRHSVHKYNKTTDLATDSLLPIKDIPGTTSSRSIVNRGSYTYYWSDTGLWRTDGTDGELVTEALQEVIEGIADASLSTVVGWVEKDRVVKMFIGDISNTTTGLTITNCVICFDSVSNTYWIEELADAIVDSAMWVEGTAKKKTIIFSSGGEAFETENGKSHDGVAIPMEIELWDAFPISPEVAVGMTRFKIYGDELKSIGVVLWKKLYYDNGLKDEDFIPLQTSYQSEHEMEVRTIESNNKAAGFILKFIETSDDMQPGISRIAAFYTGGDIR